MDEVVAQSILVDGKLDGGSISVPLPHSLELHSGVYGVGVGEINMKSSKDVRQSVAISTNVCYSYSYDPKKGKDTRKESVLHLAWIGEKKGDALAFGRKWSVVNSAESELRLSFRSLGDEEAIALTVEGYVSAIINFKRLR